MWTAIREGKTLQKCKKFSMELFDELQKPENHVEGLSAVVVLNQLGISDHAWLIVHHPDAGYLMADPTIGQFIVNKDGSHYKDMFIGNYHELEKMMDSGAYEFVVKRHNVPTVWSPVTEVLKESAEKPDTYNSATDPELWNRYEFPVSTATTEGAEFYGIWAARMEENGVNWKKMLTDYWHADTWPDPEKPKQVEFYKAIIDSRNRHIHLGKNKEGRSYSEIISEYRTQPSMPKTP